VKSSRIDARPRWIVVMAVAAACLIVGGLLGRAFDGSGLPGPLGVAGRVQVADGAQPVWSGRMEGRIVPVGWAHSRAGAIAAATNYTAVLSSELLFDSAKRRLAVDAIAAPEARGRLQRALDATAKTVTVALTGSTGGATGSVALDVEKVLFQTIPVRYRVDLYDGAHARISIWQTGVAAYQDSSLPAQEAWGVTTVELRWVDHDWKETGATVQDGPAPVADGTPPAPTAALVRDAQRFKQYRYAAGQEAP